MNICDDNRFEIIEKAKEALLDSTNIEQSPDEMKVLDNFLFRCWQMGWLDKYESKKNDSWIPCSERLPECEWGTETEALMFQIGDRIYTGYFGTGGYSRDYYFRKYADPLEGWDASDVIAWMPLPEPYKEDKE